MNTLRICLIVNSLLFLAVVNARPHDCTDCDNSRSDEKSSDEDDSSSKESEAQDTELVPLHFGKIFDAGVKLQPNGNVILAGNSSVLGYGKLGGGPGGLVFDPHFFQTPPPNYNYSK